MSKRLLKALEVVERDVALQLQHYCALMAGRCCAHLQAGLVGLEDGGLSVGLLLNLVVAARQAGAGFNAPAARDSSSLYNM